MPMRLFSWASLWLCFRSDWATARLPRSLLWGRSFSGCAITVPTVAGYTAWSYALLWGKTQELRCA